MGCIHGTCNNLVSPTMKWTGTMLNKQCLTADQRIPQTRGESNKCCLSLMVPSYKVSTMVVLIFVQKNLLKYERRHSELKTLAG